MVADGATQSTARSPLLSRKSVSFRRQAPPEKMMSTSGPAFTVDVLAEGLCRQAMR